MDMKMEMLPDMSGEKSEQEIVAQIGRIAAVLVERAGMVPDLSYLSGDRVLYVPDIADGSEIRTWSYVGSGNDKGERFELDLDRGRASLFRKLYTSESDGSDEYINAFFDSGELYGSYAIKYRGVRVDTDRPHTVRTSALVLSKVRGAIAEASTMQKEEQARQAAVIDELVRDESAS